MLENESASESRAFMMQRRFSIGRVKVSYLTRHVLLSQKLEILSWRHFGHFVTLDLEMKIRRVGSGGGNL